MNELMNDKAVYKTTPATPGLFNMLVLNNQYQYVMNRPGVAGAVLQTPL